MCGGLLFAMGTKKGKKAAPQPLPELPPEPKLKSTSEIDDIFGDKKRKKAADPDTEATTKQPSEAVKLDANGEILKPKKSKKEKVAAAKTTTPGVPTARKKTDDGFTVYSAEELGFNKKGAGGTALCPFDCDCCF